MSIKTVVILIATGREEYMGYAKSLIESLKVFFPSHDAVLFTDNPGPFDATKIYQPHLGWPQTTLMRYHAMLAQKGLLSQYDQIFYLDTDMLVCSKVGGEEVFSDGITAVLHPGYVTTFERRRESTAFVEGDPPYYQGCLVGGDSAAFLGMCGTIARNVDIDNSKGIIAVWHDESHLNRYLFDNPPAKVLTPAYCFPEPEYLNYTERWMRGNPKDFVPKIRHIFKAGQHKWKSEGQKWD